MLYASPVKPCNCWLPSIAIACTLAHSALLAPCIRSLATSTAWYAIVVTPSGVCMVVYCISLCVASAAASCSFSKAFCCSSMALVISSSLYLAEILAALVRSTASISASCLAICSSSVAFVSRFCRLYSAHIPFTFSSASLYSFVPFSAVLSMPKYRLSRA